MIITIAIVLISDNNSRIITESDNNNNRIIEISAHWEIIVIVIAHKW